MRIEQLEYEIKLLKSPNPDPVALDEWLFSGMNDGVSDLGVSRSATSYYIGEEVEDVVSVHVHSAEVQTEALVQDLQLAFLESKICEMNRDCHDTVCATTQTKPIASQSSVGTQTVPTTIGSKPTSTTGPTKPPSTSKPTTPSSAPAAPFYSSADVEARQVSLLEAVAEMHAHIELAESMERDRCASRQ